MEWLDLVAPSAAILALFVAIGLVVQSIRHGRAIKRIEERLAKNGTAALEASLERVQQLQARAAVSSGVGLAPGAVRTALGVLLVVVLLVAAGAGAWFVFLGDGDGAGADPAADASTPTMPTQAEEPVAPTDQGTVPEDPAPVRDPAAFEVTVFNASGVTGAARGVAEILDTEGWRILDAFILDEPDDITDLGVSTVQYAAGSVEAANAVAEDLEVEDVSPVDGYTDEEIGGADVVVLVGQDLAERFAP